MPHGQLEAGRTGEISKVIVFVRVLVFVTLFFVVMWIQMPKRSKEEKVKLTRVCFNFIRYDLGHSVLQCATKQVYRHFPEILFG